MPLEHVEINWVWLKEHLDRIIDEVNQNKPLASNTIAIDANTNGSMLRVVQSQGTQQAPQQPTDDPWRITPDGELAGWHQAISFDPSTAKASVAWYWGGTPRPFVTLAYHNVTTVDPSTCATTVLVLLGK